MENIINESTQKTEPEISQSTTNSESHLFEVEMRNRVIELKTRRPVRGEQGEWHYENMLVVAEDEDEAKSLSTSCIDERTVIGTPTRSRLNFMREVEIVNVRMM